MEQISTDRLRRIAKRLTATAAEYAEIADQMAANGILNIDVAGFATLENATLPRTESPANSARRALKVALFAQPGVTTANQLDNQDSDEVELNKKHRGCPEKKRIEACRREQSISQEKEGLNAMIQIECPNCKSQLKAPIEAAGRTAKCKKCNTPIKIPVASTNAVISVKNANIAVMPPTPVYAASAAPPSQTKACDFCGEDVLIAAKKCKHCGEILDLALRSAEESRRIAESQSRQSFAQPIPVAASSSSSTTVVMMGAPRRFPHFLHLILTIFTLGTWFPIWVLHYIFRSR